MSLDMLLSLINTSNTNNHSGVGVMPPLPPGTFDNHNTTNADQGVSPVGQACLIVVCVLAIFIILKLTKHRHELRFITLGGAPPNEAQTSEDRVCDATVDKNHFHGGDEPESKATSDNFDTNGMPPATCASTHYAGKGKLGAIYAEVTLPSGQSTPNSFFSATDSTVSNYSSDHYPGYFEPTEVEQLKTSHDTRHNTTTSKVLTNSGKRERNSPIGEAKLATEENTRPLLSVAN